MLLNDSRLEVFRNDFRRICARSRFYIFPWIVDVMLSFEVDNYLNNWVVDKRNKRLLDLWRKKLLNPSGGMVLLILSFLVLWSVSILERSCEIWDSTWKINVSDIFGRFSEKFEVLEFHHLCVLPWRQNQKILIPHGYCFQTIIKKLVHIHYVLNTLRN